MASHTTTQDTAPAAPGAPGVLVAMQAEVRELAATLWAARQPGELMDTVAEIEVLKTILESLELDVVRELDATDAVKQVGWASTQDFVTSVSGGFKGTGPAVMRLAQAVSEPVFAPLGEAMADGWLSAAKAHVIHRAVENLPGNPEVRARRSPGPARRGQGPGRHRAPQGRQPARLPRRPRRRGPPRRAGSRPARTRRAPGPVPDHHRRPGRRRLPPRPLLQRGRHPDHDHPDGARRTQTHRPTRLPPRHLRSPRLWPRRQRPTRPRRPDPRRAGRDLPPTPERRPPPRVPRRRPHD